MQNKNKRWERSNKDWESFTKKRLSLQNKIKEKFIVLGLKIIEFFEHLFVEKVEKWFFRRFGWLLPYLRPFVYAWDDTEAWIIENWIIPSIIWWRNLSSRDRFRIFMCISLILHMYFFTNWWMWLATLFLSWVKGEFYVWPIFVEIAIFIREYWLETAEDRMYFHPDNTFFPIAFILTAIFPYISYRLAWRNALWMSPRGSDLLNCRPYGISWFEELIETEYEELGVMLFFWVQQISYISYLYAYFIGNALLTWHYVVLSGGRMRFAVWHALGRSDDFTYWNMTSQYYTYFLYKKSLKLPFKGDFAYSEALWDDNFAWYFPNRTYFEFGRVHTLDEVKKCYDYFLVDRAYHSFSCQAWFKTRMNDPFNIFGKTIRHVPWRERNLQNSIIAPWHSWLWHKLDRSGIESTRLQSIPHVIDSHSAFRLTCFKEGIELDYAGWSPEETIKRSLLDDTSWFYFWRGWARSRYIETCYQGKADPYYIAWMIAGPVRRHGFFGHANPHSWVPTVKVPNPKFDLRTALVSPCNPIIDSTIDVGALCAK